MKGELVDVGDAQLYCEVRGAGEPLLLVVGLTGDAGWFERLAGPLAERYTVVTYDRRANSRSPRPPGWTSTTIGEQADDAAGLLAALGLTPAVVFGGSLGALIALEVVLRHPQAVRRAIAHEPALYSLYPEAQGLIGLWRARLAKGGPDYATYLLTDLTRDKAMEDPDQDMAIRVLDNGEVTIGVEMPAVLSYAPDTSTLAGSPVPIVVAAGEEAEMFYYGASLWLARRLGADLHELPGGHTGYADVPDDFARALGPLLE
jgi:pimeloyl-ACP methyl ester carboxylesterase